MSLKKKLNEKCFPSFKINIFIIFKLDTSIKTLKSLINYFFLLKISKKSKNLELNVKKDKVRFNLKIIFNLRIKEILNTILIWYHICLVFSSDSSSKLHIFWHNSDSFGMNRTKISVFKKSD